jgi:hypothetical protein
LTLIDPGKELLCSNSVFTFFTKKFWNFNDFLLQGDVCIRQNLLSELSGRLLGRWVDLDVLLNWSIVLSDVGIVTGTGSTSNWVRAVRHFIFDCRSM